jgi:hypothetical protein
MLPKTFEEFLKNKHSLGYFGTDDAMPDDYERWLGELDTQEVIDYGEEMLADIQKRADSIISKGVAEELAKARKPKSIFPDTPPF